MLTLQWTAFNHAELECAGAKSAVLQGDGHEMQDIEAVYARALDEIACAITYHWGRRCIDFVMNNVVALC